MLADFYRYARPYRAHFAAGFVFLLATNGLALSIPWLLGRAVDAMREGAELSRIAGFAGLIVVIALVQSVVRTASRLAVLGASRRIVYDVRSRFFSQLQRLDARFFDSRRTGDLMSRGVNDLRLLRSFYGPGAMNLANTAIAYVGVALILVQMSPLLTAVALALLPFLGFGVKLISARVYRLSLAVQEQLSTISNKAQENLSGMQQVRIYAQEEREIGAFRALSAEFRRRNLRMARQRGLMIALIGIVTGIETLVVLFVGGRLVIAEQMSFGDFVAFNAYLAQLAYPTIAMGWIINVFQRGVGAMERLGDVLSKEPRVAAAVDEPAEREPDQRHLEALAGDIAVRNLSFAYEDEHGAHEPRLALDDVSLDIERGTRVALVGSVGSGKSTLVNLLARVYQPPPGTIRFGGLPSEEIATSTLRAAIGYVPQEAFLFSRSLRENLLVGRPDASDEDLARAVSLSRLEADVEHFPKGLDTLIGERGVTLSGGQRQRATLARAILRDPSLLILDDALSAVDADTEHAILENLERLMEGRTSIIVTHRPAVLASVDRVLVFESGRIVEDGTHAELLDAGLTYAQIFHRHELEERLGRG